MTREEAIGLLATQPEKITQHFGITRDEVKSEVSSLALQEIITDDPDALDDLIEFPIGTVMKWTGISRDTLKKFEHQDYGLRNQHFTLRQIKRVKAHYRKKSKIKEFAV